MNKTLSIGLAGFSFTIEEHAYIKLGDYLKALRASLDPAEADEVMQDIEIRMVEIFKDLLGRREVINDTDVEKVIAQIGTPEAIEEQEEAYYSNTQEKKAFTGQRQLFRDPERAKIAGVCAGLAHYTGLDMTLMRAIWLAVFVLGVFTAAISSTLIGIIYIILWIVLPQATTATDFLKMKGKPLNFGNLKQESTKIVQFANESGQKLGEIYNESKPYVSNASTTLWNIVRYVLGTILALMGLSALIGSFAIIGMGFSGAGDFNFFTNLNFYLQNPALGWAAILLGFLTSFIPALLFLYLAMKLFSPKTKLRNTGYVIGALIFVWVGLAVTAGFTAIRYNTEYSGRNDDTQDLALTSTSDSVLLAVKKIEIPANFRAYWNHVYSDGKTVYKKDYPEVDIVRKEVAEPYLQIKRRADGYNIPLRMNVPVEMKGNKIWLPNYVSYPYSDRLRSNRVSYELVIPRTMKVIQAENKDWLYLNDPENSDRHDDDDDEDSAAAANSVVISSDDTDSIIVNGKKVSRDEADLMIKKIDVTKDNVKDINISVRNGKKEIIIKTK